MHKIVRQRVQSSFQRGACQYDQHTPVQQRVLTQLLYKLNSCTIDSATRVLDIGCGTGRLLESLMNRFPSALLTGLDLAPNMLRQAAERLTEHVSLVQGDAEQLPFSCSSFNLVLSSSTFQWLEHLDCCFGEVHRVLQPEGSFIFSLFGEGTLYELQESWRHALKECGKQPADIAADGTHRFYTCQQVRHTLNRAGFHDVEVYEKQEVVHYPDVPSLLRAIKRIGAGTAQPPTGGGLGWRRVLHAMAAAYEDRFGVEEGIPASYSVIYAAGRR